MELSKERMKFKTLLIVSLNGYIDDKVDKISDAIVDTTARIHTLMEELKNNEIKKSDSTFDSLKELKYKLRYREDLIDKLAEELSNRGSEKPEFIEYLRSDYKFKIYTEEFSIQLMDITSKKIHNDALRNIPECKRTYNVCMHAAKNYLFQLKYVPPAIRDDNICIEVVRKEPLQIDCNVPIKKMTPYFWRKTVFKFPGHIIRHMPKDLIDKCIAIHAINNNPNLIKYIPEDIIDEDIMDIYDRKCEERDFEIKKLFDNLTNGIWC